MYLKRIKNIVIVGGGTSAWLAAAFLQHNLKNINLTIVDKEIGSSVGVGEGTVLTFKWFMDQCGFSIDEWFPDIDASYKAGVLFPNWQEEGHVIWHPFLCNPTLDRDRDITLIDILNYSKSKNYLSAPAPLYNISTQKNLFDKSELQNYAYHVDCAKLVLFIQEKLKNKINFVRSEVVNIQRDQSNNISKLILNSKEEITADIFLDCTGFKSILQNKANRINLEDRLFVNTAAAGQIKYVDKPVEAKPYVICDAVEHGWIWTIPVRSRMGSGLVFNRNITDIETAKDYLCDYWQGRLDRDKIKIIDWTPFYIDNQWQDNVVSIGLSAGFIEPLESTGIALICEGITQFANLIKDGTYSDTEKIIFNNKMSLSFNECIDFVNMHYSDSSRQGNFWNFVKNKFTPSERQLYYIELMKDNNARCNIPFKIDHLFSANNWFCWLLQLGYTMSTRPINAGYALSLLEKYETNEKQRFVTSRLHYQELERLEDFYGVKNEK